MTPPVSRAVLLLRDSTGEPTCPRAESPGAPRGIPGTVARAYRELEAAGLVATRRRVGTVITASTRPLGRTDALARELVDTARAEGISATDLLDLIRSALLNQAPNEVPR